MAKVTLDTVFSVKQRREFKMLAERMINELSTYTKFVFFLGPKQVGKSTIASALSISLHKDGIAPRIQPFNAWAYRAQREWLATTSYNKDKQSMLVPFTGREHMIGLIDAVLATYGVEYLTWQYVADLYDLRDTEVFVNDSVRREWECEFIQYLIHAGKNVTIVKVYREGHEPDKSHTTEQDWRLYKFTGDYKDVTVISEDAKQRKPVMQIRMAMES